MFACTFLAAAVLLAVLALSATPAVRSPRVCERFDPDWRFHRGEAPGASAPEFDDSSWRVVDLPHDWSVEDLPPEDDAEPAAANRVRSGPFDSESVGGGAVGYTVGGVGWYRKTLRLPARLRAKRFTILFDGVYMNSEVWVNGTRLGEHPYGYAAFHFDLTPHLRFDEPNVIAVRVDASGKTSRWYPGSGIYRHVWLTATAPVHLAPWGVVVTTPEVNAEKATVHAASEVCNDGETDARVTLISRVFSPQGKPLVSASSEASVASGASHLFEQDLSVSSPQLWSPETPVLYRMVTSVAVAGRVIDETATPFGLRSFTVSADQGFVLNGQPLKLRGGCVHHDNGPLGACTYDRAEERRVELLKAAGFNAIRTAHNPPSTPFLDACDRLGVLVIDEAFDCWQKPKNPEDYHRFFDAWWQRDLDAMVLRDRNHPSVIAWSIGNEVVEQGDPEGAETGGRLAQYVRSLDPTRPVAIGAHPGTDPWENLDPLFAQLGLCGYNYKWQNYAPDHERAPGRAIAGTESFPTQCFDSWVATADSSWVIGDFVWTSFDYLGEVALGHTYYEGDPNEYAAWPWTAANCGDIDICGFRRPQSYYREVVWGMGEGVACFVQTPVPEGRREVVFGWGWPNEWPSWTWPGQEGKPLSVRVYSSCPRARLVLNGRDLGTKETNRETRFTAEWEVPYEPGELVAVGMSGEGAERARWVLQTAGVPAALRLHPDRTALAADGQDLSFVTVEVLDSRGVLDPNADPLVRFRMTGPGRIVAVCNSDPRSIESFQQPQRKAWRGRCLVIVKAGDKPGEVRLTAVADGLSPGETTITVE